MAQILILDSDPTLKTALKTIFANDEKFQTIFVPNLAVALEILNANPTKKAFLESVNAEVQAAQADVQTATAAGLEAKTEMEFALGAGLKIEKKIQAGEAEAMNPDDIAAAKVELEVHRAVASKAKVAMADAAQKLASAEKRVEEKQMRVAEAGKDVPQGPEEIINLFLVADSLLKANPAEWLASLRKMVSFAANNQVPVAVTGTEANEKLIKKYLIPGIFDYFVKPLDELLARQNLKYLASEKKELEREVYSLPIKGKVDLIYEFEIEAIGESSFAIKSSEKFMAGEFRMFSSELFLRKLERRIIGRCIDSKKVSENEEVYSSEFWFVGVDPFFLHQIRTVIEKLSVKSRK